MGLENSLPEPPESSQLAGTKRQYALPNIDRATKKSCNQLSQLPSGDNDLEIKQDYISPRGSPIISYPPYDSGTMQNHIVLNSNGSEDFPLHGFNELDFIRNPLVTESSLCLSTNSIFAQDIGTNIESSEQATRFYDELENPQSMDALNMEQVSSTNISHLQSSQKPNIKCRSNLEQDWVYSGVDCIPFEQPSVDAASTGINISANPGEPSGYPSLDPFVQPRSEIMGFTAEGEELQFTSTEEVDLTAKNDAPSHSDTVISHDKAISNFAHPSQPTPLESIVQSPIIDTSQANVCFGVIIANVASSFTGSQETSVTPVTLSSLADIMKMSFQDSGKYAGILDLPVLGKLLDEFTVEYTANLIALKSRTTSQRNKKERVITSKSSHECLVRVVVYGIKSEGVAVGRSLSDADLFLQHPSATDLYKRVEYWNPHFLLRPGSQMPRLDNLSITEEASSSASTETLNETQKNYFMQIFNSACGAVSSFTTAPSPRIKSPLKQHQAIALTMMIERECGIIEGAQFPSLWIPSDNSGSKIQYRHKITGAYHSSPTPVYGGILADEMGLGKSLSLLALVCSSLDSLNDLNNSLENKVSQATLIVTPKSTIPGWQQQVERHIQAGQLRLVVYHGPDRHQLPPKFWQADIVLTTYETLRSEPTANGPIYSCTWRRVVLDEAHHIRNRSSQSFKAVSAINAKSRWCLTGTPIHNSLDDYGALLSFLGVPQLMEKSQFDYWVVSPINRKRPNSENALGDLIRATCLRRTKEMIEDSLKLPLRIEKTEEVKLHQRDQRLYDFFKEQTAKVAAGLAGQAEGTSKINGRRDVKVLTLINILRRVCNHGEDLLPQSALEAWRSNGNLINWEIMQSYNKMCNSCGSYMEEAGFVSDDNFKSGDNRFKCVECSIQKEQSFTIEVAMDSNSGLTPQGVGKISPLLESPIRLSAKIDALLRNINAEQKPDRYIDEELPIKSVVFSQWTKMLDLIARALTQHSLQFLRIDGQSSLKQRKLALKQFKEDPACTILIASIGSAGEGVDLTAANHVHLVEPHWNPMVEAQAVDRVHRIGQTRDVVVTRYIVQNSIETYIQWIQREKVRLISHSLDSAKGLESDVEDRRLKTLQKFLNLSNRDYPMEF